MPVVRFVCPYCDTPVEMAITRVTRFRVCQHCDKSIVVGVFLKSGGNELKPALLTYAMAREAATDEVEQSQAVAGMPAESDGGRSWLWVLVPPLLAGVIGLLWHALSGHALPVGNPEMVSKKAPEMSGVAASASQTSLMAGDQEAYRAVTGFLEAGTVEQRLQWVRDRHVMEDIMRDYYRRHRDGPIMYREIAALPEKSSPLIHRYRMVLADGSERELIAGKTANGSFSVDWASFVIRSEVEWETFMREKPTVAKTFRVRASPHHHYEGDFDDEIRLGCLRLEDPCSKDSKPIYAYYRSDLGIAQRINACISKAAGEPLQLTLGLRYPAFRPNQQQVWIEEFIAGSWMAQGR